MVCVKLTADPKGLWYHLGRIFVCGISYNRLHKVGKIEQYWKKINLNSDKKRFWLSELKSLNDGSFCDSVPIPADIVANLISKEEVDWYYDDEKYEPESEL